MLCFPLDLTDYSAEALGAWFGARTRGVFSAANCFSVTPDVNLTVNVAGGLAWLKPEEYWGVCCFEKNTLLFTLDPADAVLARYDVIAIQLNKTTNAAAVVVKKGTPASVPAYPAIQRNAAYDEIYVAAIRVGAGAIELSFSDITDLRLNETYCGLMRDGVTGIPTTELNSAFQTWFETVVSEFDAWWRGQQGGIAGYMLQNDYDPSKTGCIFVNAMHVKTGTVHALTFTGTPRAVLFTAADSFGIGDTWTANGVAVAGKMPDGSALPDNFFVGGSQVICLFDGSNLFFVGGANSESLYATQTATLAAANWSGSTQTVDVAGVTVTETNTVIVSPAPSSQDDYGNAGIKCTAQGAGTLTFSCSDVPSTDITVNIVILGVES